MRTLAQAEVLADLIARLERVRPESERRWGSLTSGEMLCHLADCTRSVLSGRAGSSSPRARPVLKWMALYSRFPWPKGRIRTRTELDPHAKGTRPVEFERDRAAAIEGLRALARAVPDTLPTAHFVFGRMGAGDWLRWGYLHTDHHLRQFGV